MITRERDRKDLHRKVLDSDLKTWSKDDLEDAQRLLKEKELDIKIQLEETKDLDDDELTEEDIDWEIRAKGAKRFVKIAGMRCRQELQRREREALLTPEQRSGYEEIMAKAKQLIKENEGSVNKLRAARRAITYLRSMVSGVLPPNVLEDIDLLFPKEPA